MIESKAFLEPGHLVQMTEEARRWDDLTALNLTKKVRCDMLDAAAAGHDSITVTTKRMYARAIKTALEQMVVVDYGMLPGKYHVLIEDEGHAVAVSRVAGVSRFQLQENMKDWDEVIVKISWHAK